MDCLKLLTYIVNVTLDAAVTKILAGNSRKSNFYVNFDYRSTEFTVLASERDKGSMQAN